MSDYITTDELMWAGFADEIKKIAAAKCPGSKIKSKGKGRGAGTGKGEGPIGVPIGEKLERIKKESADKELPCPGSKIRSKGKGRGKGTGKGKGPIGVPIGEKIEKMDKEGGTPFLEQDRPEKVKKIYRALKRDHPEMPAEMKARISAKFGKPGKQKKGGPYKGPISTGKKD